MIRRVLLVVKETALQKLQQQQSAGVRHMRRLLAAEDQSVANIKPAHDEHQASVAAVREALADRALQVVTTLRIPKRPIRGFDLVITLGGDGMVLGVSHAIRDATPVLGVNSAPSFSVGYLTGCVASSFGHVLEQLRTLRLQPLEVQRLKVRIGRRAVREPVLNDALFCADNPAVMTRYRLEWPGGEELQRSSGVWISTPAGSTSALASAGGPILPLSGRQFAFIVREPYAPPGNAVRFRSAVLGHQDRLSIDCRILGASVFLDGSHRHYPVHFGETVTFTLGGAPLHLVRP